MKEREEDDEVEESEIERERFLYVVFVRFRDISF